MFPQKYTLTGEVYADVATVLHRGYRDEDKHPVLIKVLRHEHGGPENVAMLRHELAITRHLDVPGAARAIALEEQGARAALIFEDAPGQTLATILRERPLDLRIPLRIAADVARALGALHGQGVVHKQVRPQSILVDLSTSKTTLIDFSLATRVHFEPQQATNPDLVESTLAYISPEQTARMNRLLDHRTDLYSLGVTLYEMLAGAPPFRSASPLELIHSHIARRPAPVGELIPSLPPVVGDLVMKLLSKDPEDRYQTGQGLARDLDECLAQLDGGGPIQAFPLGRWDQSSELRVPQRLYGRDREIETLFTAFDRVDSGAVELLVVAGHSGVGKSALVHEVYKKIGQRKGTLLSGKFDQLNRSVPYAPVAQALGEHVRYLLSEPDARLDEWRERCESALGPNAQIIVDLVPELALILGEQEPVPPLGPIEAQARFATTLTAFLELLAADAGPLIFFLDDLHWADSATLRVLQHALTSPDMRRLLIIGAYRDNEVDAAHPLSSLLADLRKARIRIGECEVGQLEVRHVTKLVSDMLSVPEERALPLAEAVFAKTNGMPLFVSQFIASLAKDKHISFDLASLSWRWDLDAIRRSAANENVVDFMIRRLRQLDARTQRLLQLAACIGHRFDLKTLSIIDERDAAETAATLWDATQEGYVLPLDSEYRYFDAGLAQEGHGPVDDRALSKNLAFRFLHDRIQQAAYALVDEERQREVHLRIGRLLLASAHDARDDGLFDVVRHLNVAASLLDDPAERTRLARMNLAAGRRAKEGAAHEAAARYFEVAGELLGEAGWAEQRDLMFEVHVDLAECKVVLLSSGDAERLLGTLVERAANVLERARVYNLRIVRYATLGRCPEALDAGREVLALFGTALPSTEEAAQAALTAELAAIEENLAGRRVATLADGPVAKDPATIMEMTLLVNLAAPAFLVDPIFYIVIGMKLVNLSLKHGNSSVSAMGYVTYAWFLAVVLGKTEESYEFGQATLALNQRFKNAQLSAKLHFMLGVFGHLIRHEKFAIGHLDQALRVGREVGDFVSASNAVIHLLYAKLTVGEDLGSLVEEADRSLTPLRRTNDAMNELLVLFARQLFAALAGRTRDRRLLGDGAFDEGEALARVEASGFRFAACWYHLVRLRLAYLYGDHESALSAMTEAASRISSALGQQFSVDLPFFGSLTILAVLPDSAPSDRARLLDDLAAHEAQLASWAARCPDNFEHKRLLVAAERARVDGRAVDAAKLYDDAIEAARHGGFSPDEALGYELSARFYARAGRAASARLSLQAAYQAYARWGALAKLRHLQEAAPGLAAAFERAATPPPSIADEPGDHARRDDVARGPATDALDVETVMQTAQAISSELVLDKLLDQLMRIVIKSAGAQRGFLVLPSDGKLLVEASITTEPDVVHVHVGAPVEGSAELSGAIVQYVARTRETVVLGDASRAGPFQNDAYIAAARPRSVLCVAMTHLGRLDGVFYFENNLASNAFSPVKVDLCRLMAAQAAIAVENAKLYQDVRQMSHELQQHNEHLEAEVTRRTEQLSQTNARLEIELANNLENERLRAALQEEVIQGQAERLDELSAPLMPIAPGVMVMPLIGTVDARRAQQVLTASLHGAQTNGARIVILDVTGVKKIDESFANILLGTASALRLLGTQAIVTGLRPKVAQALVDLGAELRLTTMSTLQSGIAYALGRRAAARRQ